MTVIEWLATALASLLVGEPAVEPSRCPTDAPIEHLDKPTWVKHRVVPRERVDEIAHRYGVKPAKLRAWNDLPASVDKLRPKTRLRVWTDRKPPPRERIEYTVREGDTWWRVGSRHGLDSSDVRAFNWPWRNKMTPGTTIAMWVDPVVLGWVRTRPPSFSGSSREVRLGAVGVGPPDDGRLRNGVEIPPGEGYAIRMRDTAYGTTHAVEQLLIGIETYRGDTLDPRPLKLGSMSARHGGPIGHHKSHQTGRDIDIRLPRRAGVPSGVPLTPRRIDHAATWQLIRAFASTDVVVMFLDYKVQRRVYKAAKAAGASEAELATLLQYPRGWAANLGLVRDAHGHDQHIHIRFDCGPCEPECVRKGDAAGD